MSLKTNKRIRSQMKKQKTEKTGLQQRYTKGIYRDESTSVRRLPRDQSNSPESPRKVV